MRLSRFSRVAPLSALILLLAGCLQDTASYQFEEKDHAITLVRNQTWFWQDTVEVTVIALRLPHCNGGLTISDMPVDTRVSLYRAPDEYAEPIFILKAGKRYFAVSTQSCRVQKFDDAPDPLGEKLGVFRVKDDKFQFVPAKVGSAGAGAGGEES